MIAADANEQLSVTVLLRRPAHSPVRAPTDPPLSHEEFRASFGADAEDVEKVRQFATGHGLSVGEVNGPARTMVLSGTVSAVETAFQVELFRYDHAGGSYRGREGVITVPSELAGVVVGVFGLDNRPQVRPRIYRKPEAAPGAGSSQTFTPRQVAGLYCFPTDVTGQGQCIGILEFGGGYQTSDLDAFFQNLNMATPNVVAVSVGNGQNNPGVDDDADGEVALDIEVAGAVAPGAAIAVYFSDTSDQGFINAINQAVHDSTNDPSVISLSWGAPENQWTDQTRTAIDQAFADAATLGVTVTVAAGDHGSADQPQFNQDASGNLTPNASYDGLAHVDFPASSPNALACGGTHLEGSGSTISSETVWNDGDGWATGGGVSDFFDVPTWQANAGVPSSVNAGGRIGRGLPDVSGDADNATGYQIYFDGSGQPVGGTSAVAPLWAGLTALLNQAAGKRLGFLNPQLYGSPGCCQDVLQGTNAIAASNGQSATAGYSAKIGWDACTGLGSPKGPALVTLFTAASSQTPPLSPSSPTAPTGPTAPTTGGTTSG